MLFYAFLIIVLFIIWLLVYNRLSGEFLFYDQIYHFLVNRKRLKDLDKKWLNSKTDHTHIIVCLTTIPSRIDKIQPTLKSLLSQTKQAKRIRLHVPKFSIREQCEYIIPDWLTQLESVEIVDTEDFGPATKLIPALKDCDQDQALLIVDDDRIYRPSLLETTERLANENPSVVFGYTGWKVPEDLIDRPSTFMADLLEKAPCPLRCNRQSKVVKIDIIQGLSGYLVRPSFFNLNEVTDYSSAPEAAFYVDDVWLSGHCKVDRFVFPSRSSNFPSWSNNSFYNRSSLGLINRGKGPPELRHNSIVIKHLKDKW